MTTSRPASLHTLNSLSSISMIASALGFIAGFLIFATASSYDGDLQRIIGGFIIAIGVTFLPIAFLVGAIRLHAETMWESAHPADEPSN